MCKCVSLCTFGRGCKSAEQIDGLIVPLSIEPWPVVSWGLLILLPRTQWAWRKSKAGEGPHPGEPSDTHTAGTRCPALYVVVSVHTEGQSACLG